MKMKRFEAQLEDENGENYFVEFDALDYGSASEYLNANYPDETILSVEVRK
jgi:hypothetical protein